MVTGVGTVTGVSLIRQAAEGNRRSDQADLVKTFGEMLDRAVDAVSNMQARADRMTERLATGEAGDIHQVMIAVEQVNIALQLTMQIRNKVIESYQEIMRMQM